MDRNGNYDNAACVQQDSRYVGKEQPVTARPIHAGSLTALLSDQAVAVAELHGVIGELEAELDDILFHSGDPTSIGGASPVAPAPSTSNHGSGLRELTERINEASRRLRGLRNRVAA